MKAFGARAALWTVAFAVCGGVNMKGQNMTTFKGDMEFLLKHTDVVVLSDTAGKAKVAVSPKLQGRVLTSTAAGDEGMSFGWINRELIASGKFQQHINPFGGEDRFWLGPEGGQFSIFFKKGDPFDLEHWFTPVPVDTEPFDVAAKARNQILMRKAMRLENYSGAVFELAVEREVALLDSGKAAQFLKAAVPEGVKAVIFESRNRITNTGKTAWDKSTGLLSIWILGMFAPSPTMTVVIPYNAGTEEELGPVVNDAYFGKVPAERLVVGPKAIFFRGDGQYRSKIGLSPQRAKQQLGSYDPASGVLTVVQYTKPQGAIDYVNSMWELQKEPYRGDAINSYNDGPASPGAKPFGPFYELETSSPAAALAPGESLLHVHRTIHLQGTESDLDPVAQAVFGVGVAEIKAAFGKKEAK